MIKYQSSAESLVSDSLTIPIIDLGSHGFADTFFPKEMFDEAAGAAPLVCRLDKVSGLVQVENFTLADARYDILDYSYTSSNSQLSRNHWVEFIESVHKIKSLKNSRILEIGSNDGYLLKVAMTYSQNTLGVDASTYMTDLAKEQGVNSLKGLFGESEELLDEIRKINSKFDFIFANNVLNHSNNPVAFVLEISKLLAHDGVFVFEVPYWLETIKSYRFDQIYHEHVTYFTVESVEHLLNQCNLFINDIQVVDYHGGSLRVFAGLNNSISEKKDRLLSKEFLFNLKEESTYLNYVNKINMFRDVFLEKLRSVKNENIFGIGAAAKANTFLTYYGFDQNKMNFIVDSSPFKQGKITPVTRIPIMADEYLSNLQKGTGVVLAWNLGDILKKKLLEINEDLEFIESFGTL